MTIWSDNYLTHSRFKFGKLLLPIYDLKNDVTRTSITIKIQSRCAAHFIFNIEHDMLNFNNMYQLHDNQLHSINYMDNRTQTNKKKIINTFPLFVALGPIFNCPTPYLQSSTWERFSWPLRTDKHLRWRPPLYSSLSF